MRVCCFSSRTRRYGAGVNSRPAGEPQAKWDRGRTRPEEVGQCGPDHLPAERGPEFAGYQDWTLSAGRQGPECDVEGIRVSIDRDLDVVARGMRPHRGDQRVTVGDSPVVQLRDHVACLDTGLLGGTTRVDRGDRGTRTVVLRIEFDTERSLGR